MYSVLVDRAIVQISGQDKKKFLQGLLTNDIYKIDQQEALYACLLTPQGKYFSDFFITLQNDKIFMDLPFSRKEEILKKLNIYKLRSDVQFEELSEYKVISLLEEDLAELKLEGVLFKDPRSIKMGIRSFVKQDDLDIEKISNDNSYDIMRFDNFIAEGEKDLKAGQSFLLEFGFNDLNAIDYKKGCYIGQELVARTHYLGVVRKEIAQVFSSKDLPEYGTLIYANDQKIGYLCSSVGNRGLALIKKEAIPAEKDVKFMVEGSEIKVIFKERKDA